MVDRSPQERGRLRSPWATTALLAAVAIVLVVPIAEGAEGAAPASDASSADRPGFVLILVDDLGWADLGCYGSTFHDTPRLDRFAASAVRFTDAYASGSVCSPTRAAIMTGRHPPRVGITDWIPGMRPRDRTLLGPPISNELAHEERTIAELLGAAGYRTFYAGKWHLGGEGHWPESQGFEENHGGWTVGSPRGGYYSPWVNPRLESEREGEYLPDRLTDESLRFLRGVGDRAFYLQLSFYTVHTPIQACRRHVERYREKAAALPPIGDEGFCSERDGQTKLRQDNPAYASMVRAMDENVGRILDALDELHLADRTTVLFTSDNGGLSTLGSRRAPTSNAPLRAGKGWCYEGGIRVPLIIRSPGVTVAGSVSSVPVASIDFLPTILELAGVSRKAWPALDGVSLVPLLEGGGGLDPRALCWHFPHYHGSRWRPGGAIRSGRWKLVELFETGEVELYDLGRDPGERKDLAALLPERRDELLEKLRSWRKEVGALMPRPHPARPRG